MRRVDPALPSCVDAVSAANRTHDHRKNRSHSSVINSTKPNRLKYRYLYSFCPLIIQCVGTLLGSNPNWLAETRELADHAAQSVQIRDFLSEKLDAFLSRNGSSSPLGRAPDGPPSSPAETEPFAACNHFFAGGQSPLVRHQPSYRALCYDSFAILHSGQTKTPIFVAQKLNKHLANTADQKRTNRYFADARLPRSERAELDDYKKSGYSRGHMAPAGDMPNVTAMAQSFSLANMIPQAHRHNSGAWSKVEQDTRKYVQRASGNVYVITGPVYTQAIKSIGDNRVQVPDYLFKLVFDENKRRAWAHWHANNDDEVTSQPISYRELVKRTGIEFLPGTRL